MQLESRCLSHGVAYKALLWLSTTDFPPPAWILPFRTVAFQMPVLLFLKCNLEKSGGQTFNCATLFSSNVYLCILPQMQLTRGSTGTLEAALDQGLPR